MTLYCTYYILEDFPIPVEFWSSPQFHWWHPDTTIVHLSQPARFTSQQPSKLCKHKGACDQAYTFPTLAMGKDLLPQNMAFHGNLHLQKTIPFLKPQSLFQFFFIVWNCTWSFLLRAVCSFFAGSPTRSIRAASTFMCTSSLSALHLKSPLSMRFSISSMPLRIASRSSLVMIPCRNDMKVLWWKIHQIYHYHHQRGLHLP